VPSDWSSAADGPQPLDVYSRPLESVTVAPPRAEAQFRRSTGLNSIVPPPGTASEADSASQPAPPAHAFRYVPAGTPLKVKRPSAPVVAVNPLTPPSPIVTPATGAPPSAAVTRPETVPRGASGPGGSEKSSAGSVSSPPSDAAKKPIPRAAKTPHSAATSAPS
jgi:hypothetical protein